MTQITFQNVLEHLLDSKKDIPQAHLSHYSDLDPKSLRLFLDIWPRVTPDRKLLLLDHLLSHLDSDTLVSYEDIGRALLRDDNGEVRARAIGLLAESNDPKIVDSLVDIFIHDSELSPRLAAADLLGEFILLGELEELSQATLQKIEEALISILRSEENPSLRKRALEALGYSSREETINILEAAYQREDPTWVASALRAMGRSHDNRWNESVVSKLLDDDPRIQAAAAEAAGELTIDEAAPIMLQMLENEEEDDEVVSAAIWSLSQIGGEDARIYLVNLLEQTEDEEAAAFLEDALENLDFTEELNKFDLLDLDEDDDLSGDFDDEMDEEKE
ncbi:MAG TPA: HEAT repeat domain-containing protein [Anaerolineales bacterium]|nr:HEAT repeat domain-containing protein [Anaerolineales bacterium]HNN13629.1 HEAT repeat domain-containing protein [Anaerolineales bacterium]HNO30545.1 HEAT repeat domain-containing protein [Anaerolineales bacterium]